jgi:hypothetical protein
MINLSLTFSDGMRVVLMFRGIMTIMPLAFLAGLLLWNLNDTENQYALLRRAS